MPSALSYATLFLAIVLEVIGSSFLQKSEGFSRLVPTLATLALYAAAFFFLAQTLKVIPLAVAYAIWSGLGIVLTAMVGVFVFRQALDAAALVGIAMIVGGVLVMNLFSQSAGH